MIICLKDVSEERFSFSVNVNSSLKFLCSLKFLWALIRLSEGTQALGHSEGTWALGHSGTRGILFSWFWLHVKRNCICLVSRIIMIEVEVWRLLSKCTWGNTATAFRTLKISRKGLWGIFGWSCFIIKLARKLKKLTLKKLWWSHFLVKLEPALK